jgi:hypothetical protein
MKTVVIYGNCQAAALASILSADRSMNSHYRVCYFASFDDRIPDRVDVRREEVDVAAFLFEQYDPKSFPHRDRLPSDCVTVTFPSIDCNLLWPLTTANTFNDEPSAEFPWGHFPYGDRVIVDAVGRGLSVSEVLEYYQSESYRQLPSLDRFERIERARLAARDKKCDIKMTEFVFSHFREERLFWSVNHPTMRPLREICGRLTDVIREHEPTFEDTIDETIEALPPQGPLALIRVPIHLAVAEHFGLNWFGLDSVYGIGDSRLTSDEYFLNMTRYSVDVRDAQTGTPLRMS